MKINLTVDAECRHGFAKEDGSKFLLPGQEFRADNDLFPENKCAGYYEGPDIDDYLKCNVGGEGGEGERCNPEGAEVIIIIKSSDTDLPIIGATLSLFGENGLGILTATTDLTGKVQFNVPFGYYTYILSREQYLSKNAPLTVSNCVDTVIPMDPDPANPPGGSTGGPPASGWTCDLHGSGGVDLAGLTGDCTLENGGTTTLNFTLEIVSTNPPDGVKVEVDPGPYTLAPGAAINVPFVVTAGPNPETSTAPTLVAHTTTCGDYSIYLGTTVPPHGILTVRFQWQTLANCTISFLGEFSTILGLEPSYLAGSSGDVTASVVGGLQTQPHYHKIATILADTPAIGSFTITVSFDEDGAGPNPDAVVNTWSAVPGVPLKSLTANCRVHTDDTADAIFSATT